MEYPIWQLTTLGGGFWIAFIATVHVYVAHFAVGGGLLLVLLERASYKSNNVHLLEYTKMHSKFFLLLTMAFGAVSGVAIWFTIALLAPQATITLIHQFVFGWAAEWVCFMGEIVALIIYFYTWETMNRDDHMKIGWLYFLFGWLSLFLITGIVGFMLTPGDWIKTRSFWDGFFNPTFWPQLVFRSFFSAACAGLFGFVTATRIKDEETRLHVVRVCSFWTILGVIATALSGVWYVAALPPAQYELVMIKSHRVIGFMSWFWIFGGLTLLGGLILAFRMPRMMSFPLALVVLLAGQGLFGSFEFIREAGRKPYLIWDYVYSNSILKAHVPILNQEGVLAHAKWAPPEIRDGITDDNAMQAGAFLYQLECAACHSIDGPMNAIEKRTRMYDANGLDALLTGMGKLNKYMPPFAGNEEERMALASYIATELNNNAETEPPVIPEAEMVDPLPFDPETAEFALVAWADQGMRFHAENDRWSLLPAGNVIRVQLVARDILPTLITEGVEMEYAVEDGVEGKDLAGTMQPHESVGRFEAELAVLPYKDGEFHPLPIITITARRDGEIIAQTKTTLPTSDQMGCRNCHGGDWANGDSGVSEATVDNILAIHDRMNGTNHAESKVQVRCAKCHSDPLQDATGSDDLPSLSAAIHGVHAVYLAGRDAEGSCLKCHPQNSLRGQHLDVGMECTNCHGAVEDHAIGLLKADRDRGVEKVERLLAIIPPRDAGTVDAVNARTPWLNQPDCLTCHEDFSAPDSLNAFNAWTPDADGLYAARHDNVGITCAACHGSPHAVYPATSRDSVLPMQYMGTGQAFGADGTCTVCHIEEMEDAAHHENMGLDN